MYKCNEPNNKSDGRWCRENAGADHRCYMTYIGSIYFFCLSTKEPQHMPKQPKKASNSRPANGRREYRKWTHTENTGGRERINNAIRYYWKTHPDTATFKGFWAGYDKKLELWKG
jgi:hypothetical protein